MARPTKYNSKYIESIDKYLEERKDEEVDVVVQKNEEKGYKMYKPKIKVKLPTIEGFARFIEVNKTTLYEWEAKHKKFSNALEKIRVEQKQRLIDSGLSGSYNSTIAKLVLSANHGMREGTDLDITSRGNVIKGFNFIKPKDAEDNSDN